MAKQQIVTETEADKSKVIIKKRGGVGSFFVGFFFCFFFLALVFVGLFLYFYYAVTAKNIEDMLGIRLPLEGDFRNLTVKELVELSSEFTNASLDTLETKFKVNLPTTFPGTDINITVVYDSSIDFLGKTDKVRNYRIQDIVNNLNAFVDSVLPIVYNNIKVGEILTTLNLENQIIELGYPILTTEFYNVGTEAAPIYKKINDLTVTQALDLSVDMFKRESLSIGTIEQAFNVEILPTPLPNETDEYVELRTLKFSDITTANLTSIITGGMITKLTDLSEYVFTQTEEFKNTTLSQIGEYLKTVEIKNIIKIPELTPTSPAADHIIVALQNLTINDVTTGDIMVNIINKMNIAYPDLTMNKLIDFTNPDLKDLDFMANMKLADILNDPTTEVVDALHSKTLGELFDGNTTGIFGILKDVTFGDLIGSNSDTVITNAFKNATTVNLKDLLNGATFTNPLVYSIMSISVADLFGADPQTALLNALRGPAENPNTLETLFNITDASGVMSYIKTVTIGQLLDNPSNAIINAICGPEGARNTLGGFLNIADNTGLFGLVKNIEIYDLFGYNPTKTPDQALKEALSANNTTLGTILGLTGTETGITGIVAGLKMQDLFNDPANTLANIVNTLKLKDVFSAQEISGNKILNAIGAETQFVNLPTAVNNIKLNVIVDETSEAATMFKTLVENYDSLTLGTIDTLVLRKNITVGDLISLGILQDSADYTAEIKAMTLQQYLDLLKTVK